MYKPKLGSMILTKLDYLLINNEVFLLLKYLEI